MQDNAINILWAVSISTGGLMFLSISIIVVVIHSKRKAIETKAAQMEELAKSEQKYRSLFENSLAGIVRFSLESWDLLDANDALKHIFECSSDSELKRCFSLLPPRNIQDIQRALLSTDLVQEYEIRTTRNDGKELWILFSAKMIGGDHYAHGVIVDITERKVSAEKISEQAMLLDESQDAILVTDYQGRITFWNNGAELMYGFGRNQAVGSFLRNLIFDASHMKEYDLAMEDMFQFSEWSGEQHHMNNQGKELLIQSRWKKVENQSSNKKIILMVHTDITEKKRQEVQLLRAQRMESIALLTGGIAHDLQNVLAPVTMSISLLREKLTDDPSLKVLDAVEESARSGIDLVRNIITYGHGIPGERMEIDLSDLLDSVMTIVRQSTNPSIQIKKLNQGTGYRVLGDTNQLKQVFLNILVNARDAVSSEGVISIEFAREEIDENFADKYPEAKPGKYYRTTVTDNGYGIPEDLIEKIFDPFFTTKANGNGTGLGLSIAMGIVKSHAGFILVRSAVHRGTTFDIFLPIIETDL